MSLDIFLGILIPLAGTAAGAACVFLMKDSLSGKMEKILLGFASGVMVVAWIPAAAGLLLGVVFLTVMDKAVPHLHLNAEQPEGPKSRLSRTMMMVTAVILHNIPEGMAVGVVFAGAAAGGSDM